MGEGILIYGMTSNRRTTSSDKIKSVLKDIRRNGYSKLKPFSVGAIEKRMKDFSQKNGIRLASGHLYMSAKGIAHAMRDSKKSKRIAVSENSLVKFPVSRRKMKLYYDNALGNFVYVSKRNKYIVHPNYKMKTERGRSERVNFITAQKLNANERFSGSRFILI